MDKMSLETYYLVKTEARSMKAVTSIFLSAILSLLAASGPVEGKGKHTYRRAAPGASSGGVVLSTPNPQTALEHNNRGVELGSKGLWADAIREHELALHEEPNNATFRTNLSAAQLRYGDVLSGKHDYYNAIKQYRGALYVDPNNLPADEHLDNCLSALHKDPLSLKVRQQLGEDADVSGDYETAIVEYRKCVKMADDGPSHASLGRVLLKAGKPVDGFSELRIAVSKPWESKDKNELGACHRQIGDILKEFAFKAKETGRGTVGMKRLLNAATEYRRACTINPADAEAVKSFVEVVREGVAIKPCFDNYLMLGGAYLLAGDFSHAKLAYEQCYKLDSRNTALSPARVAFHQAVARSPLASPELVAESLAKVNKFLESEPDNARWWYILGRLKEHQADCDGAMDAYRRAEKINALIDPDLKMAISRLGGATAATAVAQTPGAASARPGTVTAGGTSTAGAVSSASPPSTAQTPAVDVKSLETYSRIEKTMQASPDSALQLVNELLDKNPSDGHAYLLKGSILQKQNQLDDAATAYRQADLFKEPDASSALRQVNTIRVQPHIQQADKYTQEGNYVGAADELRESIIMAPNLPVLHRKLAEVLGHLGDKSEADKELQKAAELEKSGK